MKPGPNFKRGRGRGNRRPQAATSRVSVKDGGHQEIRVRGNLQQILEKYLTLAREATAGGDRIAAENYYQHAEHYYRVLNANGGPNGGDRRPGMDGAPRQAPGDMQPNVVSAELEPGQGTNGYVAVQSEAEPQVDESFGNRQPA
ncbi:MAG: DUF4167 domain-containing protein [Alphaproteobacteria bacterium]